MCHINLMFRIVTQLKSFHLRKDQLVPGLEYPLNSPPLVSMARDLGSVSLVAGLLVGGGCRSMGGRVENRG